MECDDFAGTSRLLLDTEKYNEIQGGGGNKAIGKTLYKLELIKQPICTKSYVGKRDMWNGKSFY